MSWRLSVAVICRSEEMGNAFCNAADSDNFDFQRFNIDKAGEVSFSAFHIVVGVPGCKADYDIIVRKLSEIAYRLSCGMQGTAIGICSAAPGISDIFAVTGLAGLFDFSFYFSDKKELRAGILQGMSVRNRVNRYITYLEQKPPDTRELYANFNERGFASIFVFQSGKTRQGIHNSQKKEVLKHVNSIFERLKKIVTPLIFEKDWELMYSNWQKSINKEFSSTKFISKKIMKETEYYGDIGYIQILHKKINVLLENAVNEIATKYRKRLEKIREYAE